MVPRPKAASSLVGTVVGGRYRIIQLLGSGGTGHVYLAESTHSLPPLRSGVSRPRIALKVLRPEHASRPDLVARFEREAVAAARIHHPNVLRVLETCVHAEGERYFAMELLVGLDLADTLARCRSLLPARATRIAAAAAAGLEAAHQAGVIHRDIKPENIFLVHEKDGREQVKLLDFGFSRLHDDPAARGRPTMAVGTPEYMAPEQAQGADGHPSADIYSLGIVLYEMLAGRVPFSGPYPAIALRHAREAPAPLQSPAVTPPLEAAVLRAIEKDPADRWLSMADFARALLGTLGDLGPLDPPTPLPS
jgi:serine/threonine protein kinase